MLQGIPGVGMAPTEGVVHAAEALSKLVTVDAEHTLDASCEWVLADSGCSDAQRQARVVALGRLGDIFTRAADAYGGEKARRKWRADTFRSGGDASGILQLKEVQLPTVSEAEVVGCVTLWGALDEHTAFLLRCRDSKRKENEESSSAGTVSSGSEWVVLK
eukprot:SAG31_NODE_5668_length_2393_cov_1.934612_1_plen_160_part_10